MESRPKTIERPRPRVPAYAESNLLYVWGMGSTNASAPAANLLLVEDDEELRIEMAAYLASQGYAVHEAGDAPTARALLDAHAIALVVLDVNLPGEDGLSLCRSLAQENGPAVLMLSAMGESVDRILGLELGADDYVVKPIIPRELLARVRALLRRRGPVEATVAKRTVYTFAGFRLDLSSRQLLAPSGTALMLTRGEFAILTALLDKPKTPVTRETLFKLMRGEAPEFVGRGVDLHISRLRRKIDAQSDQELIKTHHGLGYLLDAHVSAS